MGEKAPDTPNIP